jgi:hypothetical protein
MRGKDFGLLCKNEKRDRPWLLNAKIHTAGNTRPRIATAWQAPASTTKSGGTIAKCSGNVLGGVKFQFTNHAQRALAEREIAIE